MPYPRKCEVYKNLMTDAGVLVPEDQATSIFSAIDPVELIKIDEFEATSRLDMMQKFWKAMSWGEYQTKTEIKKDQKATTGTGNSTSSNSSTSFQKEPAYITLKKVLDYYPLLAKKYRKPYTTDLHKWKEKQE